MIASADIESHEVTLGRNSSPSLLPSLIKKKPLQVALIAADVTIAAAVYWRVDRAALEQQRIQYAEGALLPIATLLRENQHLFDRCDALDVCSRAGSILSVPHREYFWALRVLTAFWRTTADCHRVPPPPLSPFPTSPQVVTVH